MANPRLSLVVAGSCDNGPSAALFEMLRPRLRDGTIEVVVATASAAAIAFEGENVSIQRCPPGTTVPQLRSAGMAVARGDLVALTEDFCVPSGGWADSILDAHARHDAIAVGGPIDRASGSAADWASTFFEYGRFFGRMPEGAQSDLPGINVVYKSRRLKEVLGGIPVEFFEVAVHRDLRTRGETLWREPRAIMFDASMWSLVAALAAQYHHGRLFGGRFLHSGSPASRMLRAMAVPVVPAILLQRITRSVWASPGKMRLMQSLPLLLLLSIAWSVGEGTGTLAGEGDSLTHWR